MSRLIILGSGTALPDAGRGNSGYCWEGPEGLLLLDCGGTPYQRLLRAGLDPRRLRAVLLSHSHPDHLGGLPVLLFHLWVAGDRQELLVLGNQQTIEIARAYTQALGSSEHMLSPRWQVLPDEGGPVQLEFDAGVALSVFPTIHSRPTLGARLEQREGGRVLVYAADSDYCPAVVEAARGASVLIHECTVSSTFKNHSTPEQAGEVARRAGVERLVLVHYSPDYTCPEQELEQRIRATGFEGEILVGRDGDEYRLDALAG